MGKKKHRKKARQVAALAFRHAEDGGALVLVMSSRETGRPVIPKGWPMADKSDAKAAATEAWQEAGVRGRTSKKPIGSYRYWKRLEDHFRLVRVDVFALEVKKTTKDWPEKGQRELAWLPQAEAAAVVDDPELATLIREASL
jgi:8-oxo-dGTP pyrophosphatase MutT (NUDIX family)